jgi:hypothetical protein
VRALGHDDGRFGTPDRSWNPIGALVPRGRRVVLKPNCIRALESLRRRQRGERREPQIEARYPLLTSNGFVIGRPEADAAQPHLQGLELLFP